MIPKLKIVQMTYPREAELGWKKSGAMLASSQASKYLKDIFTGKVSRRGGFVKHREHAGRSPGGSLEKVLPHGACVGL